MPPTLARTLRSTNCIESMISIARNRSTNVKNWQNGNMALRWCAAGMIEARAQFRRVNGHLQLPGLRIALNEHIAAQTVGTVGQDDNRDRRLTITKTATEAQRSAGQPREPVPEA